MRRTAVAALAIGLSLVIAIGLALAGEKPPSKGLAALERAAKAGRFVFIFFYTDESEQTASMRNIYRSAVGAISKSAERLEINATDAAEAPVLDKYGIRGAPMPFVLVIAPNGAISGGFPAPFEEKQILDAFATPCTQAALKALQEGKQVLVCVQNANTALSAPAMKGVQDFKADPLYAASTEIITLDPSDPAETKLMGMLGVDPKAGQAITVCLVPPGRVVANLKGATSKEMIAASLKGGGGCCAGGSKTCGPAPAKAASPTAGTATESTRGGTTSGTGK